MGSMGSQTAHNGLKVLDFIIIDGAFGVLIGVAVSIVVIVAVGSAAVIVAVAVIWRIK